MLTCLCRACTFAAWRMCKRSSPGDTPAHVLVSHSWPHFRGASDPPTCEPPALKELAYLLVFAARALLLRGGCVSEAPQATPQPTCWLVTPGHIFVGLVTHPRVSHLHLRGSHAYSLDHLCTAAISAFQSRSRTEPHHFGVGVTMSTARSALAPAMGLPPPCSQPRCSLLAAAAGRPALPALQRSSRY